MKRNKQVLWAMTELGDDLIDAAQQGIDWSLLPMYLAGVVTAAVSGYLAIRLLKYITQKGSFGGFAYYCWGAGILTLILSLIK